MNNMIGCYNVVEKDHKILLVREKTKSGFHWALPAGKIELNETLIECAIREAHEETGLIVKPVAIVGIYQTPLLAGNNVINFAFHSTLMSDNWSAELLPEAEFVDYSDLEQIMRNGQLRDFIVARIIADYRKGTYVPIDSISMVLAEQ